MTKELDIVLFGATGFTGRLVAEYLVARRPGVRWALAGRRRHRLEHVRSGLAALDPAAEALPILVGDSLDRGAMDDIARRARVVCSTAGPYAKLRRSGGRRLRRGGFYWLHSYLEHVWLFKDQVFRDKTAEVVERIAACSS
ncbi:hypothetical protein BE21_34045 [Sorangium cellulosum]|uniref:Saccharopine dehydrogenase NADP binding domain-containing protein n=1 Tax=Sorangium cellulosum TaxID=56 RepID=A0A150TPH4_SORCE|nr:hypothetical protein BE21_34045 [Sorangium cellulosum]